MLLQARESEAQWQLSPEDAMTSATEARGEGRGARGAWAAVVLFDLTSTRPGAGSEGPEGSGASARRPGSPDQPCSVGPSWKEKIKPFTAFPTN